MRPVFVVSLMLVFGACRSPDPNSLPEGQRVAVTDFVVGDDVSVQRYDRIELRQDTGPMIAEWVAKHLTARRREAVRIAPGVEPTGDLVVTGRVVRADGGSSSARTWRTVLMIFCWPCALGIRDGFAHLSVAGEVRRADGTVVGEFDFERIGKGMESAANRAGAKVAEMVFTNKYEQTLARRPPIVTTTPAAPTAAPAASATKRLEELDALRARDMITEDEYQRKRAQILDEL